VCHRSPVRDVTYTLSVPASATTDLGAGAGLGLSQRCRDMRDKVVEISGTYTGTVAIQVQVKNVFAQVGGTINGSAAPALVPIDVSAEWIRVDATGLLTGAPVLVLRGLDTRSDD
jgi:hypothetical protein